MSQHINFNEFEPLYHYGMTVAFLSSIKIRKSVIIQNVSMPLV